LAVAGRGKRRLRGAPEVAAVGGQGDQLRAARVEGDAARGDVAVRGDGKPLRAYLVVGPSLDAGGEDAVQNHIGAVRLRLDTFAAHTEVGGLGEGIGEVPGAAVEVVLDLVPGDDALG